MAAQKKTLKFTRIVNAPASEVYRAFTNSTALREWFCDAAQTDLTRGGRLHLWWNSGYYATGEYTALTSGEKIAFTWRGRNEPEATRVQVSLRSRNGGTAVTVAHAGVGSGKKWAQAVKQIERGWEAGLENLQSVLETGQDLRFVLRPMLGIMTDEFNPETAAKLGVPVTTGIRLSGTIEGMGARAAGLQGDDVIVGLGGKKVRGFPTLVDALQGRRAGDQVKVTFYRGGEKQTTTMELSRRPMPEVPATSEGLAEAVRKINSEVDRELDRCFEGVSESEASFQPASGEWSAREILAHLIHGERDTQSSISDLVGGQERWYDDIGGNIQARIYGTLALYPHVPVLLEELKRSEAETAAVLVALPLEFVARKGSYWRLGHNLLEGPVHARDHMSQIRSAIEAARKQ